jgi:hypothetical protein
MTVDAPILCWRTTRAIFSEAWPIDNAQNERTSRALRSPFPSDGTCLRRFERGKGRGKRGPPCPSYVCSLPRFEDFFAIDKGNIPRGSPPQGRERRQGRFLHAALVMGVTGDRTGTLRFSPWGGSVLPKCPGAKVLKYLVKILSGYRPGHLRDTSPGHFKPYRSNEVSRSGGSGLTWPTPHSTDPGLCLTKAASWG